MIPEVIAGIGIFTGCAVRAIVPFLKKQLEATNNGTEFKWKKQYTITIILSLVIVIPTAISVMLVSPIPDTLIFPAGFMAGYTFQDLANKVVA